MRKLVIIWRNPEKLQYSRRWQPVKTSEAGRRLYIVQELISRGTQNLWTNTSALEIVQGGRAIA